MTLHLIGFKSLQFADVPGEIFFYPLVRILVAKVNVISHEYLVEEIVMSRRITGTILLFISTLLYIARYLSAAIFGVSLASKDADLFKAMLQYIGPSLGTWSLVALIAGLVYLAWAEFETFRGQEQAKMQNKERNSRDT